MLPCRSCLGSCNNGHLWMFHSSAVQAYDTLDHTGESILTWNKLVERDEQEMCSPDKDSEWRYEDSCR